MPNLTPVWTDNVTVQALASLARNATQRATLDLRSKWGAYIMARIGRGGTTGLTNGVDLLFRRTINNGGTWHVASAPQYRTGTTAAASTTCTASGSPNNAGVSSLTVASTTSFAVGDLIYVSDGSQGSAEFCRVARVTSSTVLLLDDVTKVAHNNTGHTVVNQAEAYLVWLDGGALWEVVFDYGDDSAGEAVSVEAFAQTLDNFLAA